MEWCDIRAYHMNPPCVVLTRDAETQAEYDRYLAEMRGKSVAEHVRASHLAGRTWALVANDFPYSFSDGTRHWVLWSTDDQVLENPGPLLRSCGLGQCVWFENRPGNCSVPDIRHLHVFEQEGSAGQRLSRTE